MSNETSDPVAVFDQMGTMLENSAVMFGAYYKALIKNEIPPELASKMTNDVQNMFYGQVWSGRNRPNVGTQQ